jgi:sugar/nucleoside kinase (ribokinase family)
MAFFARGRLCVKGLYNHYWFRQYGCGRLFTWCIELRGFQPGKIKFTPGGVGRNISQNLALLGTESWLLTVVGDDFYGQSL